MPWYSSVPALPPKPLPRPGWWAKVLLHAYPTGVPSAEAVGIPTVIVGEVILPLGVASAEAVGRPTITPGPINVSPVGVGSAEAVGSPTVIVGLVITGAGGIASAEAIGRPTVKIIVPLRKNMKQPRAAVVRASTI